MHGIAALALYSAYTIGVAFGVLFEMVVRFIEYYRAPAFTA
jgi:Na+-translocating ferredoxin:NAD+ oxidoreductase RnfD subunit